MDPVHTADASRKSKQRSESQYFQAFFFLAVAHEKQQINALFTVQFVGFFNILFLPTIRISIR